MKSPLKIVELAPAKITQLKLAAKKSLTPEEFKEFEDLLSQLRIYGLTPWINTQLGKLMSKIPFELKIEESPEWEAALIACDAAFLGEELKTMCYNYGISPHGHKKELCRRLYQHKVPEVVEVMEPFFSED